MELFSQFTQRPDQAPLAAADRSRETSGRRPGAAARTAATADRPSPSPSQPSPTPLPVGSLEDNEP